MNIVLLFFTLHFGYIPAEVTGLESATIIRNEVYNFSIAPELVFFNVLHVEGKAEFLMIWGSEGMFDPLSINSDFEIYLQHEWLTIGYKHNCKHPIITWGVGFYDEHYINKSSDEFYIEISSR